MHLDVLETDLGPALCKFRYWQELPLAHRPDRYLAFGGRLPRLHAAPHLQAKPPSIWPHAHIQVAALITGRPNYRLLTMRPQRLSPARKAAQPVRARGCPSSRSC